MVPDAVAQRAGSKPARALTPTKQDVVVPQAEQLPSLVYTSDRVNEIAEPSDGASKRNVESNGSDDTSRDATFLASNNARRSQRFSLLSKELNDREPQGVSDSSWSRCATSSAPCARERPALSGPYNSGRLRKTTTKVMTSRCVDDIQQSFLCLSSFLFQLLFFFCVYVRFLRPRRMRALVVSAR